MICKLLLIKYLIKYNSSQFEKEIKVMLSIISDYDLNHFVSFYLF